MSILRNTRCTEQAKPRGSPRAAIPSPHFRLSVVVPESGPPCYHLTDNRTGAVVYFGPIDGWACLAVEMYLATEGEEATHHVD